MSIIKIVDNFYLGLYSDINNSNTVIVINVSYECKKYIENVIYLNYPFYDIPTENLYEKFTEITNLINYYIKSNKTVYIHCSANNSRSITFIIAYLIKFMNYSFNTAYDYLFNIIDVYINIGFINQLIKYEKDITGKTTLDFDKIAINYICYTTDTVSKDKIKLLYYECNKDINLIMKRLI